MQISSTFSAILMALLVVACDQRKPYQPVGQEVFPPVAVEDAALYRMDNLPISPAFFDSHWTWVGFGPAQCTEDCQARLRRLNSINQGQALFVITDFADHQRLRELAAAYPDVAIGMGVTAVSYDEFATQFATGEDGAAQQMSLFLVSPWSQVVHQVAAPDLEPSVLDSELIHVQSLLE